MSIPKIIHYCWFGNPNKPKDVQRYINNWHKMLPDYQFMEWNETNCDLDNEIDYVKEAYEKKKYAFVADYIRVKRLYEYGGVYFDTDVEVVKRFDEYLEGKKVVLGFQGIGNLGTAFIATEDHNELFGEFLDTYSTRHFILEDGSMDMSSINVNFCPLVIKRGLDISNDSYQELIDGIAVYPTEYFCAFDIENWHKVKTVNTCTVHHMASSWRPKKVLIKIKMLKFIMKIIGDKNYDILKAKLK